MSDPTLVYPQDPLSKVALTVEAELRKWCLERAFETRALKNVPHMAVTNLAEEYYRWIVHGASEASMHRPIDDEVRA